MFMPRHKVVLNLLRLNGVGFNSQQDIQTNGCFSSKSKLKKKNGWNSFDYDAQRNWSGDVPTVLPSLLVALFLCQRGQTESWIHTNQMLKCEHYGSDVFFSPVSFFFLLISHWCCGFVPSLWLVHDLTSLTYKPTDDDYSDRRCTWTDLVSRLEQRAVCHYWSVLCCFNLF